MRAAVAAVFCALLVVQLRSTQGVKKKTLLDREGMLVQVNSPLPGCHGFSDWFKCSTHNACIHRSMVCDGTQQCGDGSDEQPGCSRPETAGCPPERPFQCSNSERCLRRDHLCDSYNDCVDGSDERNCPTTTPRPTPSPPPTHSGCPSADGYIYVPVFEKCYKIVTTARNWTAASQFCAATKPGAHLLFIGSSREQGAVLTTLRVRDAPKQPLWIGGEREGRTWSWRYQCENGTPGSLPMGYSKWGSSEPNDNDGSEACVALMNMSWWDGTWNDDVCSKRFGFVCEIDI